MRKVLLAWLLLLTAANAATVNHWPLSDDAANTTVDDPVGSDDGTLSGGDNTDAKQTDSGPGGSINYSFDMNGTDDYVDIAAAGINKGNSTAGSFLVWFQPDSVTAKPLLARPASNFQSILILDATTIRIDPTVTGNVSFTVPAMSTSGTWYCLLVTFDASNNARVFLNGTESSSGSQTAAGTFELTTIGRRNTGYFDGRIAQVRYYNSDESANAATIYAEGVSSGPVRRPNLNGNFQTLNGNMQ